MIAEEAMLQVLKGEAPSTALCDQIHLRLSGFRTWWPGHFSKRDEKCTHHSKLAAVKKKTKNKKPFCGLTQLFLCQIKSSMGVSAGWATPIQEVIRDQVPSILSSGNGTFRQ